MTFLDEDIYDAVKNYIPKVSEYVNSHGGDIKLLGAKDGVVYIELVGACGGCSMSLMTTKMVVQKKLRELIHPELIVTNVDGTAENAMPEDAYTGADASLSQTQPEEESPIIVEKHGMLDNLKGIIGL
jgi:Fe-S cluster biogenesis protein NfuA